jgi:hypothetical protein
MGFAQDLLISGILRNRFSRRVFSNRSLSHFEPVSDARRVSDRIVAYNLYIDPPLGRAGMTEAEVRKSGKRALMVTMAMEDVSRAYEKGETSPIRTMPGPICKSREAIERCSASRFGAKGC